MTPPDIDHEAHIARAIDETTAALADGKLDLEDIATLVRNGVEIAEKLDDIPPDQKRQLALDYAAGMLDEFWHKATPQLEAAIVALDIPYLSDGMEAALFDPIAKRLAPPLVKHVAKAMLPSLVDLVIDASKGGVQVNTELWTKAGSVLDLIAEHGDTIAAALKALDKLTDEGEDVGLGAAEVDALAPALAALVALR